RRVRLDEGDRGPPAGADADVVRRRGEGALRAASLARGDADHDPDRSRRPRIDPVALERLPALRRRPGTRSAGRGELRSADGDARPAAAHQPAVLARLHAAALPSLQPVLLALSVALV